MINLVESNYLRSLPVRLDTVYGCDTLRGDNSTKKTGYPTLANDSIYHFNPCMHSSTSRWNASVAAYKELLSTNVAPYRPLDTVPNYTGKGGDVISATGVPYSMLNIWSLTDNERRILHAPKRIKRYATETNPAWSYFTPETAGTDKYGFSILPTGIRNWDVAANRISLFGEAAGFWTGTLSEFTPTLSTTMNGVYRLFIYNMQLNAVMPHGIMTTEARINVGNAVRCIARKRN
jgi:hypothetical protein